MKIRYLDGPRPYNVFLAGEDAVIQDPCGISREMRNDYAELLVHSLQSARESLKDTPKKLSLLAKAGVVDAESGGRMSRMKGFLANALNLKPIVSVDVDGKGTTAGKSFSRRGNMKKILPMIMKKAAITLTYE